MDQHAQQGAPPRPQSSDRGVPPGKRPSRAGFWIGFLAGGWMATLAVGAVLYFGGGTPSGGSARLPGLRQAHADDQPVFPGDSPGGPRLPTPRDLPDPLDLIPDGPVTPRRAVPNPGGGTSDSNRRSIALSASIGGGESVVYYFDTVAQRLLVYQYKGRLPTSDRPLRASDKGGLRLLAARQIDFDLQLQGYRDLSERTRSQLRSAFEAAGGKTARKGAKPKQLDLGGGK